MNDSAVQPRQSRSWKNSTLSLPKKPSHAALSGERPFRDIDPVTPTAPHAATQSGVR